MSDERLTFDPGADGNPLSDAPEQTLERLEAAAQRGDPEACYSLAHLLLESGDDDLLALLCGLDPGGAFLQHLERSAAARPLPPDLLRAIGAGLAGHDPELLFDAAIGLAAQPDPGRLAFFEGARPAAVGWIEVHGPDLLTALGLG